jgi:hypothetical protein
VPPKPSCLCMDSECGICGRRIKYDHRKRNRRTLPLSLEEAHERRREFDGLVAWPPIWESISVLEREFPHLMGVK